MSKRCPECQFVNEDSRIFCSSCGSPLDAELRLIQNLEKHTDDLSKAKPKAAPPKEEAKPANNRRNDDEDYDFTPLKKEEKKSPLPWIIVGVIVVVAIAAWFMLK